MEIAPAAAPAQEHTGKVLKMIHNPRMGGSVPTWVKADSARDEITGNLSRAQGYDPAHENFKSALAYQMREPKKSKSAEFGFLDLLDMVNPLQHIPLVSTAYRRITGDDIKSPSRIIGGAIFGGPAGAAGGIVNVIVEHETGKDVGENALALLKGKKPSFKNQGENPETRLAQALDPNAHGDLPASLLAFTDMNPRGFKTEEQNPADNFSPYEIY